MHVDDRSFHQILIFIIQTSIKVSVQNSSTITNYILKTVVHYFNVIALKTSTQNQISLHIIKL